MKLTSHEVGDMEYVSVHAFQLYSSCYLTKAYPPKQDALHEIAEEMGIDTGRKEAKERFIIWRLETWGHWETPEETRQIIKNQYPGGIPIPPGFKLRVIRDDD